MARPAPAHATCRPSADTRPGAAALVSGLGLALAAGGAIAWALGAGEEPAASLLASIATGLGAAAAVFAVWLLAAQARAFREHSEALCAAFATEEGLVFVFRPGIGGALRCSYRNSGARDLAGEAFTANPIGFADGLLREVAADGKERSVEHALTTAAGPRMLRWVVSAHRDLAGKIRHVVLRGRDITEIRDDEAQRQLAAAVLAQTRDCVVVTGADGRIVLVNQAFCDTTGYRREEVIGRSPALLASGLHDRKFFSAMWDTLGREGAWQGEVWNRRKDGEYFAEALSITALRDEAGVVSHYVGVFSDVTAQKAQADRLAHLAHHDPLTQLPNRALFRDRLGHAIDRADRNRGRVAVMFLDLDGFKAVNDRAGHETGDRLLKEVARRLSACMRKADTVCRLGGDEFTILVEPVLEANQIFAAAERIIAAVNRPVTVGDERFHVGVSIGMAIYPDHAGSADELLDRADQAMYLAKQGGKNRCVLHSPPAAEEAQAAPAERRGAGS